jgi:hypothetical protein
MSVWWSETGWDILMVDSALMWSMWLLVMDILPAQLHFPALVCRSVCRLRWCCCSRSLWRCRARRYHMLRLTCSIVHHSSYPLCCMRLQSSRFPFPRRSILWTNRNTNSQRRRPMSLSPPCSTRRHWGCSKSQSRRAPPPLDNNRLQRRLDLNNRYWTCPRSRCCW